MTRTVASDVGHIEQARDRDRSAARRFTTSRGAGAVRRRAENRRASRWRKNWPSTQTASIAQRNSQVPTWSLWLTTEPIKTCISPSRKRNQSSSAVLGRKYLISWR